MSPHLSFDLVADVRELLRYPFMVNALEAGSILALLGAVVGWFAVLRRETFAAHTLAVLSFPGASAAALAGLPLGSGYLGFCAAGAVAIGATGGGGQDRSRSSTAVGTVQVAGFALGFVFLSLYGGVLESLESLLFGSFLGITHDDVVELIVLAACILALFAAVGRPLLLASVDEDTARARGIPVRAFHIGFLLVLGLTVASVAQITGVLLVFVLLVAPAAAAQELTARIGLGLAIAVALGLLVVWVGLGLSYFTDWPGGFTTSTVAFAAYVLARGYRMVAA